LSLKLLVSQVDQSTARIAELVKAVKSYSYMDESPTQDVDIHEGIQSRLMMLGAQIEKRDTRSGIRSLGATDYGLRK
jgi:C4-dicarboxylate-specific signal transduction histidine kinase